MTVASYSERAPILPSAPPFSDIAAEENGQLTFSHRMAMPDENPVTLWERRIPHLHGLALAPKYFCEPRYDDKTMPELIERAKKLILQESIVEWRRLAELGRTYGLTTAFEGGRERILSTAASEEAGIAAFELWSYFSIGNTPQCAAIYGIRREDGLLRGALLCYGIPPSRTKDQKTERLFDRLSDSSIEGIVLHVNRRQGHKSEKLGFNLGTFEQV